MKPRSLALLIGLTWSGAAQAQTADWRFHWQPGQVLQYRVDNTTEVTEVVGGNKLLTGSKVKLVKRWEVVAVDAQGVATLHMSITSMRNEQSRANGEVVLFDSQAPDTGAPELRERMSQFIGKTLAVVRVDSRGQVVDVKQGVASRYEVEPPFVLTLPTGPVGAGQGWERNYSIVMDPPMGNGAKHAAQQKYTCSKVDAGLAVLSISTALTKMPENKADQLPLLQELPLGEIVFDLAHGRLHSAHLTIDRQIEGHTGEGSSYRFQSTYNEQYAD